jgi:HK97 gp10 family phage protein
MADDIKITIRNADQIAKAFRQAPQLMRVAFPKAINKALLTIGGQAARNAPVRTGNLRSSILDPNRGLQLANSTGFVGSVGSGTGYGGFVEGGTRFMRARPYLRPAVESTDAVIQEFFTEAVDSVFSQISRDAT